MNSSLQIIYLEVLDVNMFISLEQFYKSKEWLTFRAIIISERTNKCEECKKLITESKHIQVHHTIELTLANVNDYSISLDPHNVKVLCHDCHNKAHKRFGYQNELIKARGIYIVYGAPCSGKTTYVIENKRDEDIVIDLDRICEAITLLPRYNKPDNLKQNVFAIKNLLIDNIKTRYGRFYNAWIIGGYANKYERERLARDLGAELVYINASKEECLRRLYLCDDYRKYQILEWESYINKWFDEYLP